MSGYIHQYHQPLHPHPGHVHPMGSDRVYAFRQALGGGPAVLTWGVTTSLSRMIVVLKGWTHEPGSGSDSAAETTGHKVVMTDPSAGMVSLM
jgi:hypothetical protein